jgi:hypothetical protein
MKPAVVLADMCSHKKVFVEDDPQSQNSKIGILHEMTIYDLCGLEDDDEVEIEKVDSSQITRS